MILRRLVMVILLAIAISAMAGCAIPAREPAVPPSDTERALPLGISNARFFADGDPAPMIGEAVVLGTLAVFSGEVGRFGAREGELLAALADLATIAIHNAELIRESYQGIRPAPGYPACPDHSLKPILFDMLGGAPGEVSLTENFAMLPTSAVSGFYFGHRDSRYFGVARIGQDQLDEYAHLRDVDIEIAARWLRPNLD